LVSGTRISNKPSKFHDAIMAESGKALVGYETARTLANIVTRSSIPSEPPWMKLDAVF
jgi:hypothetical protein